MTRIKKNKQNKKDRIKGSNKRSSIAIAIILLILFAAMVYAALGFYFYSVNHPGQKNLFSTTLMK